MMRKKVVLYMAVAVITAALAGCGRAGGTVESDASMMNAGGEGTSASVSGTEGSTGVSESSNETSQGAENAMSRMSCELRIVDGAEEGNLVLAGETAEALYVLNVSNVAVYLDGEPAEASVLEDGMMAEVVCSTIMETYPAQFGGVESISVYSRGTRNNPMGTCYDLCGLYLQVLDDLWDRDSGLNYGASYVSVDLSDAPGGLTEGEKAAITYIFACRHQVEGLSYSPEELVKEGYLTEVEWASHPKDVPAVYQWEDGVLFSITADEWEDGEVYSLPVVKFDAEKWRSPLGAYYFNDCKAVWAEAGSWGSYSIGGEMIS